jgi:hypothetical protein
MSRKRHFRRLSFVFATLVALGLSAASFVTPVRAQGDGQEGAEEPGPVVAIDDDIVIMPGQVIQGDVIAIGGNVTVEVLGSVEGNVLAIGGDIYIDGTVRGNAVSFGGTVTRGDSGFVHENVFMLGRGGIRTLPLRAQIARDAIISERSGPIISGAVSVLVIGLLSTVATQLAPAPLDRVRRAIVDAPVASGMIGVLSLVIGPLVAAIMTVTCVFSPLAVIIAALYTIGALMGWAALGILLGSTLLGVAGVDVERMPWTSALLGTMLLTFAVWLVGLIPGSSAVSAALGTLALSVGLGAVALTRFGSRVYE